MKKTCCEYCGVLISVCECGDYDECLICLQCICNACWKKYYSDGERDNMKTPILNILSIDAWRNCDGGWDWNQWYKVGVIPLDEFESLKTPRSIIKYMRHEGYLSERSKGMIAVEDDQYNMTILQKSNRRPLFAIEYGPAY